MIAPLLIVLALLGAWEAYARLGGVDELILPAPTQVAAALVEDRALLAENFAVTGAEIAVGMLAALAAGLLCAVAVHLSPALRRAVYPLLVGSQTIPIAIVAPLIVFWLGFGLAPKVAIVALVCFFPIVVPTLDGLRRVDPELRKLMRTLDASRWQAFRLVEAPAALPGLFTGARLSVAVATLAAILAEQAGSERGLGRLVLQALPQFETARAYAAVLILAAFAVTLFAALGAAERLVVPWAHRERGSTP